MRFGSDKPAQFTVDHVRVADTFSGRNALIVTTTKKEKPLYEGDDYITFHIDHVDSIVKVGNKHDIRYPNQQWLRSKHYNYTNIFDDYEVPMHLSNFFTRLQPHNQFNYKLATAAFLKSNAVKRVKSPDSSHWGPYFKYVISKKKTKAWVKQNINRFIFTEKALEELRRIADEELNRDMEDQYYGHSDGSFSSGRSLSEALDSAIENTTKPY
jgi:hypothetical protein